MVSNRLSSRAVPPEGPGAPAAEEAAAGPGPKEVARVPKARPVRGVPWAPAPAKRASLIAELPKAATGMLAVKPVGGKTLGGKNWLSEKAEGLGLWLGVVSERRLLMAASRDALEDSGRVRFLAGFLGRGKEELAPKQRSLEELPPEGASPEMGCSWGRASAVVGMEGGRAADSQGGTLVYRLEGFWPACLKCFSSSLRTCTKVGDWYVTLTV